MTPKINLIVAVCENLGIGINGGLPWKLKSELAFFSRMTKATADTGKKNVVIMGRRTWESIPCKFRPLPDRVNVVLTSKALSSEFPEEVLVCPSFEQALEKLRQTPLQDQIETAWVIGGSSVYSLALQSEYCHRVYLTKVHKVYECDTFLPPIDETMFKLVQDSTVPQGIQEENGTTFEYLVYEKIMHESQL